MKLTRITNPTESSVDQLKKHLPSNYHTRLPAVLPDIVKLVKLEALLSNAVSGQGTRKNLHVLCPS